MAEELVMSGSFWGRGYSRSLDIAESSSFYLKSRIPFQGFRTDLASNMLPFPITIRPDEEAFGTFCFILDIGCDVLLFLQKSCQPFRWWAFNLEKYTLYQP